MKYIIIFFIFIIFLFVLQYLFQYYYQKFEFEPFETIESYDCILEKNKIFSHTLLSSDPLCPH